MSSLQETHRAKPVMNWSQQRASCTKMLSNTRDLPSKFAVVKNFVDKEKYFEEKIQHFGKSISIYWIVFENQLFYYWNHWMKWITSFVHWTRASMRTARRFVNVCACVVCVAMTFLVDNSNHRIFLRRLLRVFCVLHFGQKLHKYTSKWKYILWNELENRNFSQYACTSCFYWLFIRRSGKLFANYNFWGNAIRLYNLNL